MPIDLELRIIDPPVMDVRKLITCIEKERRRGAPKERIRRCVQGDADRIYRCISGRRICREHVQTLKLSVRGLEFSGFDYAEKLVFGLDYSYVFYSFGVKPVLAGRSVASKLPQGKPVEIQPHKHFSGDVSGSLGEAVFAYIAVNHLGIQQLAHLRPHKTVYPAPDFIVEGKSDARKLEPLITPSGQLPANTKRVFVECKAAASNTLDKERIKNALVQLSGLLDNYSAGLLFILHKPYSSNPPYVAHAIGMCFTNC